MAKVKQNGAAVAAKPNPAEKFKKAKKGNKAAAAVPAATTPKAILNIKEPKNKKGVDILAKMKQGKQSSSEEDSDDDEDDDEEETPAVPANGNKQAKKQVNSSVQNVIVVIPCSVAILALGLYNPMCQSASNFLCPPNYSATLTCLLLH